MYDTVIAIFCAGNFPRSTRATCGYHCGHRGGTAASALPDAAASCRYAPPSALYPLSPFLFSNFFHLAVLRYSSVAPMTFPDVSVLTLDDPGPSGVPHSLQDDFDHTTDRYLLKIKSYAKALPYSIESNSKMQDMLDFICMRIVQCVEAKDYDPGFLQWDSMLT